MQQRKKSIIIGEKANHLYNKTISYDPEKLSCDHLGVLTPRLRTGVLNDRAILLSAGLRQTHKGMKAGNDSALSLVTQPAKVTADRGSK